jgi:hypothetical protein
VALQPAAIGAASGDELVSASAVPLAVPDCSAIVCTLPR